MGPDIGSGGDDMEFTRTSSSGAPDHRPGGGQTEATAAKPKTLRKHAWKAWGT
jgi:hypothetical protein